MSSNGQQGLDEASPSPAISSTQQHQQQQQQQQHPFVWPKQLNGVPLSRASSNSSSLGASPARPPKSERRRSSASPESVLQYTMTSPTISSATSPAKGSEPASPPPARRSSILSNLNLSTSSPPALASIKAGSTPVTPNTASFQDPSSFSTSLSRDQSSSASGSMAPSLQRNPSTSTADILASTLDSYHRADLSREHSSASSSKYSSSIPASPALSPAPVASFTAGLDHQLSPSLGPLRIESTTGSKATVIRPDKKKKTRGASGVSSKPSFSGGISSEDIFGASATDSTDDALSDVPSRASSRRSRAPSISSRIGRRSDSQGVSSNDVFGRPTSPSSPRMPSLSNMLSGLRKHTSRSDSQASSRAGDDASRASSRSNASLSASASEHESVMSDRSSNGRRKHRFSDILKRKTDADRAEEEEHLRILSELRLKALALASTGSTEGESEAIGASSSTSSSSNAAIAIQRANAELLVRDMEKQRLSRADTVSSMYSSGSGNKNNDDTITSPAMAQARSRSSSRSSSSYRQEDGFSVPFEGGEGQSFLLAPDRPSADVPLDADGSDEESNTRKSFAATGRRATLMPTSSHSSLSDTQDDRTFSTFLQARQLDGVDDEDDRRRRDGALGEERRRSTLTPAHVMPSDHAKAIKASKRSSRDMTRSEGTEADVEDEQNPLTSSVLDRRRSTIKAGQAAEGSTIKKSRSRASLKRAGSRDSIDQHSASFSRSSPRTSAIVIPSQQYPSRPRNQSLSSSTSIRSINAEAVLPPVRSSSRPDSPPSTGLPLEQRSISMQSLSQRLIDPRGASHSREQSLNVNVPSNFTISSRHAREGASASARTSEPSSPTSPARPLPSTSQNKLAEDIMSAMQSPDRTEPLSLNNGGSTVSRRSSAEQVTRGTAPRPNLGYHRRSSSDMLALMSQQRQRPQMGHHRRSSSSIEAQNKALPTKPQSQNKAQRRSASLVKLQQQHYAKVVALLTRNKPLPEAVSIKEELRASRSAGERAVVYARKINDLAKTESGLVYWLSQTRPSAPDVQDLRSARRRSSAATVQSNTPLHTSHHHMSRDDNYSEAAFPIRHNSQDVYKARDITQRTPSVAPSTMVPNNIPYPGVYEDSQTLRTSSAMSSYPTSSTFRSQSHSFASAALNAAGLPKVGFFGGLGRKSSKRAASSRHKASDGAAGLSISGPIRAPSPEAYSAPGTRSVSLRPSGPRPSGSAGTSDREVPTMQPYGTIPTSSSVRSLASIPQGSVASLTPAQLPSRPSGSPLAYVSSQGDEEALTAMADVLPQASKEVLAKYLAACNGDQFAAISAYFDDQRRVGT